MTIKKYQKIRLVLVVAISIIFSLSITNQNYLIPIATLASSSIFLIILRRQVKEVIADERDYALAGQSASLAIQIYSWMAVVVMFILYAFRNINPSCEPVALTLAYSVCVLVLIYSLIFRFQNKIKFASSKNKFLIFIFILTIFIGIMTLRLFSGEDNWICQNGQWIKHGNPNFSAPITVCK